MTVLRVIVLCLVCASGSRGYCGVEINRVDGSEPHHWKLNFLILAQVTKVEFDDGYYVTLDPIATVGGSFDCAAAERIECYYGLHRHRIGGVPQVLDMVVAVVQRSSERVRRDEGDTRNSKNAPYTIDTLRWTAYTPNKMPLEPFGLFQDKRFPDMCALVRKRRQESLEAESQLKDPNALRKLLAEMRLKTIARIVHPAWEHRSLVYGVVEGRKKIGEQYELKVRPLATIAGLYDPALATQLIVVMYSPPKNDKEMRNDHALLTLEKRGAESVVTPFASKLQPISLFQRAPEAERKSLELLKEIRAANKQRK